MTTLTLALLLATGCGANNGAPPPQAPTLSAPRPAAAAAQTESAAVKTEAAEVKTAVLSAINALLSNDFAKAQQFFAFSPAQADSKTRRTFADFSAHLNQFLALKAKDAGLKSKSPFVTVAEIRKNEASGMLVDISISAAEGLLPLNLTAKTIKIESGWLVDFNSFILALVDALDE